MDEIREYTHTPTPKLHAAVSVVEQVYNNKLVALCIRIFIYINFIISP